jgi:hypothetical protein
MKHATIAKQMNRLEKVLNARPGSGRELNVTVVYEDAQTWRWARAACDQVQTVARAEAVRTNWWKMDDLSQPGVLAGAVSKAMRAELLVVALRATEGLPMWFYVWVNSWLPHRPGNGALLALFESANGSRGISGRVGQYLRALARQGRMEFIHCTPDSLLDFPAGKQGVNADFYGLSRLLAASRAWS